MCIRDRAEGIDTITFQTILCSTTLSVDCLLYTSGPDQLFEVVDLLPQDLALVGLLHKAVNENLDILSQKNILETENHRILVEETAKEIHFNEKEYGTTDAIQVCYNISGRYFHERRDRKSVV